MTSSAWWKGLPLWLKLVDSLVAVPAWLAIIFLVANGQGKTLVALGAVGIFAAVAILHVVIDRRTGVSGHELSGINFGDE